MSPQEGRMWDLELVKYNKVNDFASLTVLSLSPSRNLVPNLTRSGP